MKKLLSPLLSLTGSFAIFIAGFSLVLSNLNTVKVSAFDYSKDTNSVTLNPGELIEKITGNEIDVIEKNYVNTELSEYSLTYQLDNANEHDVEVTEYLNNLYVSATPYTFKDKLNRNLSWVPTNATYKNQVKDFTLQDDTYKCNFDNYDGETKDVDIKYSLAITLPKNDVNSLINATYNAALPGYNKLVSNNEKRSNYESSLEAYYNYLSSLEQYELDKAAYEKYLVDKNAYDIKLSNYNAYLEAYAKYEQELEVYNQYLADLEAYNAQVEAYANYLSQLEYYRNNYEANKELYDAYLSSKVKIDYRLRAMQIIFESMTSFNRTIYDAVMGDSVTNVLSRKDDIVSVGGVPAEAVDRASLATSELRVIFRDYKALETDKDRYEYYRLNWSHIRDNINDLARCLNKFLHHDLVFNLLASQDNNRLDKYLILVAQLIYLADAINVSPVYNYEGWNSSTNTGSLKPNGSAILSDSYPIKVSQKQTKTYKQILEGVSFMDTSLKYGRPGPEKYDQELITQMTEPKEVEAPGEAPARVKEPVAPNKVENPGDAPSIVNNPGSRPSEVKEPIEPAYFDLNELEEVLGTALLENKIIQRVNYTSDVEIVFENTQNFDFKNTLKHIAKIYDDEGNYIKDKVFINGLEILNSELPDKKYDKIYDSYKYDWYNSNGELVDLSTLSTSCNLYATLVAGNFKNYTVTFDIDGVITSSTYHYGDVVEVPTSLVKEDTYELYYEFIGWDKQIAKVEENVTYIAIFKAYHYIFINKVVDEDITIYRFKPEEFDDNFETPIKEDTEDNYYEFDSWIISNTDEYHLVYVASFTTYDFIVINWIIDENTQVLNDKYKHTETIRYPYSTPTKEGDEHFATYILDYWMNENGVRVYLDSITSSITLYAHFVGTNEELYTVYFYVDGEIIYSNTYASGSMPVPPSVSKEGTIDYYYHFLGWDKPIVAVNGNANYSAVFELRYYLVVNVVVEGTSTIQTVKDLSELILNTPTKPASNGYTYLFKEWNISNTDDIHYTYEAIFNAYFKVTFINEQEIDVVSFRLGDEITYKNPTKTQDYVYYYTFKAWKDVNGNEVDLASVDHSITLYAEFESHYVIYTVTWILGDTTQVDEYHYQDYIKVPTNTAKSDSDTCYYEFDGWNDKIPSYITENIVISARYIEYYFTIVNANVEDEVTIYKFKDGEDIFVPDPIKENDKYHDYEFLGWDIVKVDAFTYNYTAKFKTTTYVYVTWMNGEEVIEVEKYVIGSIPSYKGSIPTKDEEETLYYVFDGWDADLTIFKANSDVTIHAKFKTIYKIAVIWVTHDSSITEYYKEGEALSYPNLDIVPYYDNSYFYSFSNWDKPVEGVVTKTIIFNAIYARNELVKTGDKYYSITNNDNDILVNFNGNSFGKIDIKYLLKLEKTFDEIKPVKFVAKEVEIYLSATRVQYLIINEINVFELTYSVDQNLVHKATLNLYKNDSEIVEKASIDFDVKLFGTFDIERSFLYIDEKISEGAFTDTELHIPSFKNGSEYKVVSTYNIDIEYSTSYKIEADKKAAQSGEEVTITTTLSNGYKLTKVIVEYKTGEKKEVVNSFIMPACDVKIYAEVERLTYKITFIVDGKIVSETTGYYGDIVLDPGLKDPTIYEKASDEEYRYVFIGWDKEITTITEDTVYTAVFEAIPLVHNVIKKKQSIVVILLSVGGGILVLGAGIAVTFIIIKRKK